jgi:hypothetical protein
MSLIERSISEQADTVLRKLEGGRPVDQAEAVGLAQEVVRLSRQHAGAVDRVAELEAELVKVRESRDAWRLQAMREHDAADPTEGQ